MEKDGTTCLDAAREVGRWLSEVAIHEDGGLVNWPTRPEVGSSTSTDLVGGLSPIVFMTEMYRLTGEDEYLELAQAGGRWLITTDRVLAGENLGITELTRRGSLGLFTGLAGHAVVFSELARCGVDASQELSEVFDKLIEQSSTEGTGRNWMETTEVLWGTAGIGFTLLEIGPAALGGRAIDVAAEAGDWLLSVAEQSGPGLRWTLGSAHQKAGRSDPYYPNFAHGTAGIGAFLARLATATGERRFLDAARSAAQWVLTTCKTNDGGCIAFHNHWPITGDASMGPRRAPDDTSPLYTLGWCHGPAGLGWFFRELEIATGDAEWAEWIGRTAVTMRDSGIPEQLEPGFWDNFGRCCGSASVAEYFLDLHQWRDDPDDLDFARRVVDDALDRAVVDERGMRWQNVEIRRDPPALPAETGWMQGASGIGSTLLRMHGVLTGNDGSQARLPHAPRWN